MDGAPVPLDGSEAIGLLSRAGVVRCLPACTVTTTTAGTTVVLLYVVVVPATYVNYHHHRRIEHDINAAATLTLMIVFKNVDISLLARV